MAAAAGLSADARKSGENSTAPFTGLPIHGDALLASRERGGV
jgi:hypothetical protein